MAPAFSSMHELSPATDPFVRPRASNAYDRLVVDVPALFARFPLAERRRWGSQPADATGRLYAARFAPLGVRRRARQLLHRLHLDLRWLRTFDAYWTTVLGGRPLLAPEDFHFLRGVYRLRHQDNQVPDTDDPAVHTAAWQQPELLYQLFAQVHREQLSPRLDAAAWLRRLGARSFCEYGCATAPVTAAYREFFGSRVSAHLVDLPTVALHYAAYRFGADDLVVPHALEPAARLMPPDIAVDAIVCTTVFEHLLDPLEVAHRFAGMLNPGGHLIFDYMETAGDGLDSIHGARQRGAVLDFIDSRFEYLSGNPRERRGQHLAIARLRS